MRSCWIVFPYRIKQTAGVTALVQQKWVQSWHCVSGVILPWKTDNNNDEGGNDSSLLCMYWAPGTRRALFIHYVVQSSQWPLRQALSIFPLYSWENQCLEKLNLGLWTGEWGSQYLNTGRQIPEPTSFPTALYWTLKSVSPELGKMEDLERQLQIINHFLEWGLGLERKTTAGACTNSKPAKSVPVVETHLRGLAYTEADKVPWRQPRPSGWTSWVLVHCPQAPASWVVSGCCFAVYSPMQQASGTSLPSFSQVWPRLADVYQCPPSPHAKF